jgi:hypothetical protein
MADGAADMREFIDRMRATHPHSRHEIKRTFIDGDHASEGISVQGRTARPRHAC